LDSYLLRQINTELISRWRSAGCGFATDAASLISELRGHPATRLVRYVSTDASVGCFRFYTSGSSGERKAFPMSREALLHRGLAEKLDAVFQLTEHKFKSAAVALPMASNPMGMKYCFALTALGLNTIPAGVHTHNFSPTRVVETLLGESTEFLVCRPLEAELYGRYANLHHRTSLEDVLGLLVTGEVCTPARFAALAAYYPNADVRSVYGLTELNAGLFSCKFGHYHFAANGQTLIEVVGESPEQRGDIRFTVLRPDTHVIRYATGDIGRLVARCPCGEHGPALAVRGRATDEIADDVFLADFSDGLFPLVGPHNVFACRKDGRLLISVKSTKPISPLAAAQLRARFADAVLSFDCYVNDPRYMPLMKSCTVLHEAGDTHGL